MQADLLAGGVAADLGRDGMSGEQVLRALVIKQANGFSYEELAFHLADSQSYRAFCLIGFADKPRKKSTLQRNIKLDTNIIRKDRRDTLYGHKVFLTAGASGLIVDCIVERGNPRDSEKAVALAKRAAKVLGHAPEQICFDGGFSARSKAPGIAIKEMIKRTWLYQRLRHFRAGIEGIISFLKRSFGWDRCAWRSYGSFRAYAWSSVIAANLVMLARHALD